MGAYTTHYAFSCFYTKNLMKWWQLKISAGLQNAYMQNLGTGGMTPYWSSRVPLHIHVTADTLCITQKKLCTNLFQVDSAPQNTHNAKTGKGSVVIAF